MRSNGLELMVDPFIDHVKQLEHFEVIKSKEHLYESRL